MNPESLEILEDKYLTLTNQFHELVDNFQLWNSLYVDHREDHAFMQIFELMRDKAKHFFTKLDFLLQQAVTIQICRMTDPHRQGKGGQFENFTIEMLLENAKNHVEKSVFEELEVLCQEVESNTSQLRKIINKQYAHTEMKTLQDMYSYKNLIPKDQKRLKEKHGSSYKDYELAITTIREFLHTFGLKVFNIDYEISVDRKSICFEELSRLLSSQ